VRAEVVPLLDDIAERDVVPLLARLASLAREAVDHLDAQADEVDPADASQLVAAPPVVARAAVRTWLRRGSEEQHPPDAATVERVLAVARGEARATEVGRGWRVARSRGRLRLEHG
jgi:tRNA(Ile)-lysidine synthase